MSDNPFESAGMAAPSDPSYQRSGESTVHIRRVNILSVGKVFGALYAVMGLIAGGFISLVGLAGAGAGMPNGPGAPGLLAFGTAAIVILPVIYGIGGFIGGIIMGLLYNAIASTIGGIEMDLKKL